MQVDLREPMIQGTDREKLEQIRSYLYQLIPTLRWAFENVSEGGGASETSGAVIRNTTQVVTRPPTEAEAEATFESIKALIINSSDIIEAYAKEINESLSSEYVAVGAFGTYRESTKSLIQANADGITQSNEKIKTIESVYRDGGKYAAIVKNEGYVRAGYLDEQAYGLEVGQIVYEGGVETFRGFGRFTPEKISFYDRDGTEVAWLSNRRLRALEVEAVEKQQLGGFVDLVDDATGDVKTKWVGRSEVTWRRVFI